MEAYQLLGLAWGASREAIKNAHRRLVKQHHPDLGGTAEAFRRVNALQLLLARSPLIQSDGVQPVKLSRDKPADPLTWELTARFANLKPREQAAVLTALQADGLARRVQVLERAGVLR